MNVREPDGSLQTYIDAELGPSPNDVTNVAVTLKRPDGTEILVASYPGNLEYLPEWNEFFVAIPGSPEKGLL